MAPPGPPEPPEPLPRARPPEIPRKPVELAAEGGVSLPLCTEDAAARCSALGAAFDAAALALYRPSPYFAAGGALSSSSASGRVGELTLEERVIALAARLRVYLVEQGELDPYLELGFGVADVRRAVASRVEERRGPWAEVGGGADVILGPRARLGVGVAVRDVFVAGTGAERRVGAVFRVAFGFGEPL